MAQKPPATTPDGVPLAGWWSRVWAQLLDGLIVLPVFILATLPLWGDIGDVFREYFDAESPPSYVQIQRDLLVPLVLASLIGAAISLVYNVAFLMWKQATPGKLLMGLRIRLRETPGRMPFGTVFVRWLTQFAPSYVLGQVPLVGNLSSMYVLLDSLWPLWDGERQAIHDKAAKTNVVRIR